MLAEVQHFVVKMLLVTTLHTGSSFQRGPLPGWLLKSSEMGSSRYRKQNWLEVVLAQICKDSMKYALQSKGNIL